MSAPGPWTTPIVFECGCTVETGDRGLPLFVECPLHMAASDLLDIARAVAEHFADTDAPLGERARAAIRKAGRTP